MQANRKEEWSCGHICGSMCQECFRLLAARAHELAEENMRLREEVDELKRKVWG